MLMTKFSLHTLARTAVAVVAWASLIAALAAWLWLYVGADRGVLGTLLAFGPRWFLLLPLVALAPTAAIWRRRSLGVLAAAGVVLLGPVLGLAVPWRGPLQSGGAGTPIRIVSCNVQGNHDLSRLWGLIEAETPDVVALQEWPNDRPWPEELGPGWHVARHGGELVASRFPIAGTSFLNSPIDQWRDPALLCELATPSGPMHVCCLHLMTPRSGIDAVIHERLSGVPELAGVIELRRFETESVSRRIAELSGPKIILGDFNMPAESRIYRDCFGQYANGFSTRGWGYGWTKFTRWHGVRIDHVLADDSFRISQCHIGPDVGSDHRPVVAELLRTDID